MKAIGTDSETNEGIKLDLPILTKTRLLIQANSGGGKSYLLRKVLEVTYGHIQHIVLDMEGEFSTLREKHDYLLVGKEGDIDINIKIAEILPKKLLELNVSTIIDLYELKHHERILFVKRFLNSMINTPKSLWHPCMVVIDEAHIFCPEKGKSEAMSSVVDLATRGRKRGFVSVLATQRLSKLHKDVAAELLNKLIGRTSLDIDMKRASDELGFVTKKQMLGLRDLDPGNFFAFGPALSKRVIKMKVGAVKTTHPEAGLMQVDMPAPATPDKIKKLMEKLGNLSQKADDELRTAEDYERKIRSLKYEINTFKRQEHRTDKESVEATKSKMVQVIGQKYSKDLEKYKLDAEKRYKIRDNKILNQIKNIADSTNKLSSLVGSEIKVMPIKIQNNINLDLQRQSNQIKNNVSLEPLIDGVDSYPKKLRFGAMKMLKVVVMFYPKSITKNQIAALSLFSAKGGTFNTYLSELKRNGWVVEEDKRFIATEEGMKNAGKIKDLPTEPEELVNMWASKFRAGAARMLKAISKKYPSPLTKEELGELTDFTITGGTFNTYLSELRRNNLIIITGNEITASKELFLEN